MFVLMTEPVGLDAAIASQVRRYRIAKDWSVRQLAEECQKLGMTTLTEASLGNIERGQRAGSGAERGRRRVLVAELAVLAKALDVPPVLLIFPVDNMPEVEVIPGQVAPVLDALRWFTAEGPFSPDDIDRFHGGGQYDPQRDRWGFGRRDTASGFYEWYHEPTWEQGAAPVILLRQFVDRVTDWLNLAPIADVEQRQQLLAAIHAILAEMRRRGMPAPPLPPALDSPRGKGDEHGGPDQAG
jgi:transcriptional regulator with XRE-family HTH domain